MPLLFDPLKQKVKTPWFRKQKMEINTSLPFSSTFQKKKNNGSLESKRWEHQLARLRRELTTAVMTMEASTTWWLRWPGPFSKSNETKMKQTHSRHNDDMFFLSLSLSGCTDEYVPNLPTSTKQMRLVRLGWPLGTVLIDQVFESESPYRAARAPAGCFGFEQLLWSKTSFGSFRLSHGSGTFKPRQFVSRSFVLNWSWICESKRLQ